MLFIVVTLIGAGLLALVIPAVKAYWEGGAQKQLDGLKTIILGYIALFIGSLPDLIDGLQGVIPGIKEDLGNVDLTVLMSPHAALVVTNGLTVLMIITRVLGLLTVVSMRRGRQPYHPHEDDHE